MKKIAAFVLVLSILISTLTFYRPVQAATHEVKAKRNNQQCGGSGVSFEPSTITIASGDTITFSVSDYPDTLEIHYFPGGSFTISPGANHTTSALVISVPNYYATAPSDGCQKGTGSVTVQENTSPPPPAPTPTALALAAPPTTPTPPPPTPNSPPAALKLDLLSVDGDKIDTSKPISLDKSKPLKLSGYTIANGVVNLIIHSAIRNEIARADASGYWSFVIENLEPGNHTVDATVTDQTTHQSSPSTTLIKFAVTGEPGATKSTKAGNSSLQNSKKAGSSPLLLVSAGILSLALVGGGIFWFIKRPKKPTKPADPIAPQLPPTQIAPTS
jgi:plastocyanin